jgi:diguanylate cyclase (GGDEF)-like protein
MLLRELQRHQSDHGRYGRLFAVLFADVDHFKNVNDQFGHDIGDKVLKLVAATLSGCLRANDTVGRWGGEEFLVLAQVADQQQAMALGERLRNLVASPWIDADGARISVTLSIGVAVIGTGESAHTLVDRADTAMFTAKTAGRNRTALG